MQSEELLGQRMAFFLALRQAGVGDHEVLKAFEAIPREFFIPDYLKSHIYGVHALEIDEHVTLEHPTYLARCIQNLDLNKTTTVLEFGSGIGYSIAVMSKLSKRVTGIERIRTHAHNSLRILEKINIRNATVIHGHTEAMAQNAGPFDRILSSVAFHDIPDLLIDQLKPGGILIAPMIYDTDECWTYRFSINALTANLDCERLFPSHIAMISDRLA